MGLVTLYKGNNKCFCMPMYVELFLSEGWLRNKPKPDPKPKPKPKPKPDPNPDPNPDPKPDPKKDNKQ